MAAPTAKHLPHHPPQPTCGGGDCLPNCTLEVAMDIIVGTYHQYAPREGMDDYLSLKDMTELLQCQAPHFLETCGRNNPQYLKRLFKEADVNGDRNLSFGEYIKVVGIMTDFWHEVSHGGDVCNPGKD